MSFADLSVELMQQIIHEYMQSTDIYEVIRAREVCSKYSVFTMI